MLNFFQDISTGQWIILAALGALFLWPRKEAILSALGNVWPFGSSTTTDATPDANAVAAAYQLLAQYLDADAAKLVREGIAERFLTTVPQTAKSKTKTADVASLDVLIALLEKLLSSKSEENKS